MAEAARLTKIKDEPGCEPAGCYNATSRDRTLDLIMSTVLGVLVLVIRSTTEPTRLVMTNQDAMLLKSGPGARAGGLNLLQTLPLTRIPPPNS